MKAEVYAFMCLCCAEEWESDKVKKRFRLGEECPKCGKSRIMLKKVRNV